MDEQRWAHIDRALHEAIAYLMADGWPTRKIDEDIAERIYTKWIADTDAHWQTSGDRDREPLLAELDSTFSHHYGDEGGKARTMLLALALECRSRETGRTRASIAQ